jgi:hypothetical protein
VDLAFQTDLLYLDVSNSRIGVKTATPQYDLDINGTTRSTDLITTGTAYVGNVRISGNTIDSVSGDLNLTTVGSDKVTSLKTLEVDDLRFDTNVISSTVSNADIDIVPNGSGKVDIQSHLAVTGNIDITGNLVADGDITISGNVQIGDDDTDTIIWDDDFSEFYVWSCCGPVDVTIEFEVCECEGNTFDCNGECSGDALYDSCGVCDNDTSNDNIDQDCAGVCFGNHMTDAGNQCCDSYGVDNCNQCWGNSWDWCDADSNGVNNFDQWGHGAYNITVADVPEDQGGRVYVNFNGSYIESSYGGELGPDGMWDSLNVDISYTLQRLDGEEWIIVESFGGFGEEYYTVEATTLYNNVETEFRVIPPGNCNNSKFSFYVIIKSSCFNSIIFFSKASK